MGGIQGGQTQVGMALSRGTWKEGTPVACCNSRVIVNSKLVINAGQVYCLVLLDSFKAQEKFFHVLKIDGLENKTEL